MSSNPDYDRWYAARHVRILLSPSHRLETFGNTLVNYHLISELDDHPGKIRVREGRLEAHQPLVIAPHFTEVTTEGFSDEAKAYVEWLKANEESMRILRYGYCLKTDNFSEQIVTDSLAAVTERVKSEVMASREPADQGRRQAQCASSPRGQPRDSRPSSSSLRRPSGSQSLLSSFFFP